MREVRSEIRQKHIFMGVMLYVLSTVFVCYLSFEQLPDVRIWNALLWIIILFASLHAISRSFQRESTGYALYLYTLAKPGSIIGAKILFSLLVMAMLITLAVVCYLLFLGTEVLHQADLFQFFAGLALGAAGISISLTLISGIAAKAGSNMGLMALLSFPVLLPTLIVLMAFSSIALDGLPWSENTQNGLILLVIDGGLLALSFVLFPYLWRD